MLPRSDAPARQLPYTTADMAERLAKKKAEQDAAARAKANQALRFGVTNPPAVKKDEGGGTGLWPSWSEIGNAAKWIYNNAPESNPISTPINMGGDAGVSMGGQGTPKSIAVQPVVQAVRRAVGDITAIPHVGADSPSYTADQIRQQGVARGVIGAGIDYATLASMLAEGGGLVKRFGPSVKSGFAEELARFQAGNDAGVLGYGGRERPQLNLTGQPKPRLTADQLSRATGESPFAQGIGDIIKNTVQDVPRANPIAGAKMPPNMMEEYIGRLTSELDSIPEWMKPKTEVKPQIQRPINEPMTPAKAQQYATPIGNQNQIWPSNWDNVNLGKEIDLTKRFANASEATMAGKDAANKWAAQKAFRDQLMQQIENGNVSSFNSNVFPSYIKTPQDMIRFVEISDLSTLINNPIMANDYIDLMRLFGQ